MKKFYILLATVMLAIVPLNAQLVVKWGDPNNYIIETQLVDGNYFGENNGVYLWENGSQHQFIKIHGIDRNYLSGQTYNEFYFYIRVTGTQTYSDGQGGTVIGPRVNEDGYPVGIPGFDYYTVCESGEYQGVFYYYNYSEFMVGYTRVNGYYGTTRCNLSSYFDQTDGISMGSVTTGRLIVLQAENGTMAAQWITGEGKVGAVIGEGGVSSKVDIPLTSNLVYNDNTGADAQWRYLQLSGSGTGSDSNPYDAAFHIKTGSKTGTFGDSDLDMTQTYLKQNGTAVEWTSVTVTVTETSTSIYGLTAVFTGTDGKTYNVTATYEDCPPAAAATDPLVFSQEELVYSVNVASGSQSTVYYLDWHRDGVSGRRPCTRLVFCFYKSGLRYINGMVMPPDGTYSFSTSTNVPVWSVAGYRWVFSSNGYYSMYYDENGTKYYLNSGSVTVSTQSDGVYITINARGGTGTSSTNKSFNITIIPKLPSAASGYRLDTYVNGRGTVTVNPDECFYAEGDKITLTPEAEEGWTFSGWTVACAGQITDNHDGTYTYTVPASDCSVIANFEEGISCTYNVSFDANGGNGTMETQTFNCGVGGKLNPLGFTGPEVTVTYDYHGATSGNSTPSVTVDKPFDIWEDNKMYELHDDEEDVDFSPVSNGETVTMTAQWRNPSVTLPTPEKTGFTFNGWYTEETGGTLKGTGGANVIIAGDITLHAQWTANGYTVTFNNYDGTELQSVQVQKDEHPVYTGETPVKPQDNYFTYTFSGWSDGTTTYAADAELPAVTDDVTYYALYSQTEVQYVLTWDVNGGAALTGDYTRGNVGWGTQILAPDDPARAGYQFEGWVSSITNEIETPFLMPVSDLTYTAQWTANTYKVHFVSNNGEAADDTSDQYFTYDEEQSLNANVFAWEGHTFLGWATSEDGEVVYADQETVSNLTDESDGTVNLYAVWSMDNYTVTFQNMEADGGHVWWSGDFVYGETPVYGAPAEPSKDATDEYSYTFIGWTDGVSDYPIGTALSVVTDDVTYYAVYSQTEVQYVLTWDVNGGAALTGDYTQGNVEWGTPIEAPEYPTRDGYQFEGWVSSITNEIETPFLMPVSDLTYTAQWKANTYKVHFVSNNGEAADDTSDQYFTYDEEQSLNANVFAWEGHTFLGWAAEENGGVVYTDQQIVSNLTDEPDGTVNLYAVWELTTYTVRFENFDGNELLTFQVGLNTVPAYEDTPARENEGDEYNWYEFAFTGWTDGDNNYAIGAELPAVTADVTYTAQYSKKLYVILQENMDADYYTNFHNKYNGERATTATLNRQFGQGKWSTLCLPFDVPTGQLTALGLMNRVYEFKYTKGNEQEGITLYFSQAKKLEAGKGYIVNANAALAKKESFVFANALINTAFDEQSGFDIANLQGYNSQGNIYLVGTLRTGTLYGSETGSRYMGLKDNKIYYPNSDQGTSLRAYRGIFLNTGEEALPARVRIVAENGEGEIVSELEVVNGGLEETSATRKFIRNGILYIDRNGQLFDAKGQRAE